MIGNGMRINTKKMTAAAMLAALTAVLGMVPDFGTFKITLESFPVLLSGLMFGPVCGLLTGGIGTFLSQLLKYGLSVTTPLWLLPYVAAGLLSGLCAKKAGFSNTDLQIILITALCQIVITLLNSLAMYADAVVFGYYSPAIWGSVMIRAGSCLIKTVAFGLVFPVLLKKLAPFTGNRKAAGKPGAEEENGK